MTDLTMVVDGLDIEVTAGRHGLYYATSRHIPGLLAVAARIEHMPRAVREAMGQRGASTGSCFDRLMLRQALSTLGGWPAVKAQL